MSGHLDRPFELTSDTALGRPELAGIPVPNLAWESALAAALHHLFKRPPRDLGHFPYATGYIAKHGGWLEAVTRHRSISATGDVSHNIRVGTAGAKYDLAKTLLVSLGRHENTRLSVTLKLLLLEFQLRGWDQKLVGELASTIRGLSNADRSPLIATLSDPDGLAALSIQISSVIASTTSRKVKGLERFWSSEMAGRVASLQLQSDARTCEQEESFESELNDSVSLDDPLVTMADSDGLDDDGVQLVLTPEVGLGETAPSLGMRALASTGINAYRSSARLLLREPDSLLPWDLLCAQWEIAREEAEYALGQQSVRRLKSALAALLVIEIGLTGTEMHTAAFASKARAGTLVLDTQLGLARRFELRPSQAAVPMASNGDLWLPAGSDLFFQISPVANAVARAIEFKTRHERFAPIFGDLEHGPNAALNKLASKLPLPASTYRSRLAAHVAESLGEDAAQITFGESFGSPVTGTYYASFDVAKLLGVLAQANPGLRQIDQGPAPPDVIGHVGSKVRPRGRPLHEAWKMKGRTSPRGRGRPSPKAMAGHLSSRRDALALHFMFATGHRPVDALSQLTIDDLLLEDRMAVISDKRSDEAHMTRLVCTGKSFQSELAAYLSDFQVLAKSAEHRAYAKHLDAVMDGTAPLFSLPSGQGAEDLNVAALIASLPSQWQIRPNVHRHMLCQWMIDRGLTPELRYAQMGWHDVGQRGFFGDSPKAPVSLGHALAPLIDDWLREAGWGCVLPSKPKLVLPKLGRHRDWIAINGAHLKTARSTRKNFEKKRARDQRDAMPEVGNRLAADGQRLLESKVIRVEFRNEKVRLIKAALSGPVQIDKQVVLEWLRPHKAQGSLRHAVASRMLYVALSEGCIAGHIKAWRPPVPVTARSITPSPFVKGVGRAQREVSALRQSLINGLGRLGNVVSGRELSVMAVLAVWIIAADTCYRDLDQAKQLVLRCNQAHRSENQAWVLRIPSAEGHVALSGAAAIVLSRLCRQDGWHAAATESLSDVHRACGSLIKQLLPEAYEGLDAPIVAKRVMCALQVVGAIELGVASRLLADRIVAPATVVAKRAASVVDGVTVESEDKEERAKREYFSANGEKVQVRRPLQLSALMRYFDPRYDGRIGKEAAKPAKHRSAQLKPIVKAALAASPPSSVLNRLLLEYFGSLLEDGGPRSPGGLEASTIYKIYHQLKPFVRTLGEDASLTNLDAEEIFGAASACSLRYPTKLRMDVLHAIRAFVEFAAFSYPVDQPDWGVLHRIARIPMSGTDPALLADHEVTRVIESLQADADVRGLSRAEHRRRELVWISAVLMEASGARPASIYGLTLSDIYTSGSVSYMHLRESGRFASIKTRTSSGFVTLAGDIWNRYSARLIAALQSMGCAGSAADRDHMPLFQKLEAPLGTRYRMDEVFDRVGELVRWATSSDAGRTYWLRKRRIWLRHSAAYSDSASDARRLAYALRQSGHRDISTSFAAYLGEREKFTSGDSASLASRDWPTVGRIAGISPAALAIKCRRRLGSDPVTPTRQIELRVAGCLPTARPHWQQYELADPPPVCMTGMTLGWTDVKACLMTLAAGHLPEVSARRLSMSIKDAVAIAEWWERLQLRIRQNHSRMAKKLEGRSRATKFSSVVAKMVEREDGRLLLLANEWASSSSRGNRAEITLLDPKAVAGLDQLLCGTGIHLARCTQEHLYRLESVDGQSTYGAWTALRRGMLVAWVADRVTSELDRDLALSARPECEYEG